jgi:hypothetical protein
MRMNGCRGDSLAAVAVGNRVITAVVEPRFCQAGTEPVMAWRDGTTTLKYVPGGPNSCVATALVRTDGSIVFGAPCSSTR